MGRLLTSAWHHVLLRHLRRLALLSTESGLSFLWQTCRGFERGHEILLGVFTVNEMPSLWCFRLSLYQVDLLLWSSRRNTLVRSAISCSIANNRHFNHPGRPCMSIDLFFKDTQGLGVAIGGLITKSSYVGSKRKNISNLGQIKLAFWSYVLSCTIW